MASSSPKCEERVRQRLIEVLVEALGFPRELIAIEKQLAAFPHVPSVKETKGRRLDLLCYAKNEDQELFPLLLIECKHTTLNADAKRQALGYNEYVQAPYVALAKEGEERLIFPQELNYIPHYSQLLEALCR